MLTLIGSLIGFFSAAIPEMLSMLKTTQRNKHEQAMLKEHVSAEHIKALAKEREALYQTYSTEIKWVDALNGTVRPVVAYAFFMLYAAIKVQQLLHTPWLVWTEEDQMIFASVISFYFGQRAMRKRL